MEWLALEEDDDSHGNGDKGHSGSGGDGGLRLTQYGEGDGRMIEEMQIPSGSCHTEGSLTTLSRKKRRMMETKDVGDGAALGTLAGGASGE